MKKFTVGSLIAVVLTTPLGCSVDRRAEVEPGEYIVIDIHSESNIATISGIETLVVERESNTIVIELAGWLSISHYVCVEKEARLASWMPIQYWVNLNGGSRHPK